MKMKFDLRNISKTRKLKNYQGPVTDLRTATSELIYWYTVNKKEIKLTYTVGNKKMIQVVLL